MTTDSETEIPKNEFYDNSHYREHSQIKDERRQAVYSRIKSKLPEKHLVYYGASGSDPIPGQIFGNSVIYGSLEKRYFDMLDSPSNGIPLRYKNFEGFPDGTKPKYLLADVYSNPFPDHQLDLVIINMPALFAKNQEAALAGELARILKPGGVFILEDEGMDIQDDIRSTYQTKWYRNILAALRTVGFQTHPLQKEIGQLSREILRSSSIEHYRPMAPEYDWQDEEEFPYFFEDQIIKIFKLPLKAKKA